MSSQPVIHPSASVDPKAEIGRGTVIGPGAIIEQGVVLGEDNWIGPNVYIAEGTTMGSGNRVHMGAVIGHEPQDLSYKGAKTFTRLGDRNQIREYATIHRGTKEGTATVIGSDNYLMCYTHVAHNCVVGNRVILVNNASLTGHCIVEDGAFLSGFVGLHQFSKIGSLAIVSALSAVNKDIPPYMMAGGRPACVQGINVVGLRRAGFSIEARREVKEAYKLLYKSDLNISQALERIKTLLKTPEVKRLVEFIEGSDRGIAAGLDGVTDTLLTKKGARQISLEEENF